MENETSRIEELETRIEHLENAVAELRADYFGRMAPEDEKPASKPPIDFSEAYGATGGLVYHPRDDVKA